MTSNKEEKKQKKEVDKETIKTGWMVVLVIALIICSIFFITILVWGIKMMREGSMQPYNAMAATGYPGQYH